MILNKITETCTRLAQSNGWASMATLGAALEKQGITKENLGVRKLKEFFLLHEEDFCLSEDCCYVRVIKEGEARVSSPDLNELSLSDWCNFDFGYVLSSLARQARPEDWRFRTEPYGVLRKVLEVNFVVALREGKVREGKSLAAFHTGLYTERCMPIFFVAEKTNEVRIFKEFATPQSTAAKRVILDAGCLPGRQSYGCMSDRLFYVENFDLAAVDVAHIARRAYRLPLEFVRECAPDFTEEVAPDFEDQREFGRRFASLIDTNTEAANRFSDRLIGAVRRSLMLVEENWNNAVPSYNPKQSEIVFLLPLMLVSRDAADAALVVAREGNRYVGVTVLSLAEARLSSRVISRSVPDWLR